MANNTITIQFRRGTTAQNDAFTGKVGSLTVDLEKKALRLHDGETAGGFEILNSTAINSAIQTAVSGAVTDLGNIVNSVAGRSGNVVLTHADISDWDDSVGTALQEIQESLGDYVLKTQLGVATSTTGEVGSEVTTVGVATLDENGKIPTAQLPALAISSVQTVANDTAKQAIVTTGDNATVQEGDFLIVTNAGEVDENGGALSPHTYILDGTGAWVEITAGNAVLSVNGQTGVVQLTKSDVGLGNVDNFATATTAEAQTIDNPANDKFLTVAGGVAMFEAYGIFVDEDGAYIDQGSLDGGSSN